MAETLTTTVTELPESRVRVLVRVPADELEDRVERKARELGRQLKLPGFRKGKVPAPLVIQRVGRGTVLEEAVRDTLGQWYASAIETSGIVPVGDPDLDLGDLPVDGGELEFSIEIGVLPTAELGEYKGLEVPRAEPTVAEERIDQEIDGLRDRLAKLETVEHPAEQGDFVVIDYEGFIDGEVFEGGEGRDQLVELGSGNLIPGFEEGLLGANAGESRAVDLSFPADYGHEPLAGKPATFQITVKEIKRKQLPELDEDFATDAGFDTVEELRADIRGRLAAAEEERVQGEFSEAALDAAVAQATVQTTPALAAGRASEMFERTLHSLSHRGINRETYLSILGRTEEEILTELTPDAEQALKREAVITAVVAAEAIVPSDEQVLDVIRPMAEREGVEPDKLLEDLRASGRLDGVREELAARQAVELIAAAAKPIPVEQAAEQAQAREKLWTPEQAQDDEAGEAAPAKLWTPDS
jgi:trigger factor